MVSFKNTIIVMTSNAGAHTIGNARSLGFGAAPMADHRSYEAMKDSVMKEVKDLFRPEFINRLDEMIVFHSLTEEDIRAIADLMLSQVASRMQEQGITLHWDKKGADYLAQEGYDARYGARPLRRMIQRTVEDLLSEQMLCGAFTLGDDVRLSMKGEELTVKKERKPAKKTTRSKAAAKTAVEVPSQA